MKKSVLVLCLAASFLVAPSLLAQDSHKKVKETAPQLESAIPRAITKSRKFAGQKLVRVSVAPTDVTGDDTYLIMVEFASGATAIFQGDEDPANDSCVLIDKNSIPIIDESLNRGIHR